MRRTIIGLLLTLLLLVGCAGPAVPGIEEAPYRISWNSGEGSRGAVYCDNYELGSSVVIDGYWEYESGWSPGFCRKDGLLILDAGSVRIEKRKEESK